MAGTTSAQRTGSDVTAVKLDWQLRWLVRTLAAVTLVCVLWYAVTHAFMLLAQIGLYASNPSLATDVYLNYVRAGCFIFFGLAALGVGTLTLAAALARTVSDAGRSRAGLYLLCVAGVCDLLAAIFPDDAPGDLISISGTFHTVSTPAAMLCIAAVPLLFARGFRRDARWHDYASVSLALGVLAVAALLYAGVALGLPAVASAPGVFSFAAAPFAASTLLWLLLTALYMRRTIPV